MRLTRFALGGLLGVATVLALSGCGSSSSSSGSSTGSSSTPPSSTQMTQFGNGLGAVINGMTTANNGTSVPLPPGTAVTPSAAGQAPSVDAMQQALLAAHRALVVGVVNCNFSLSTCTYTNSAGTVSITVTWNGTGTSFSAASLAVTFANYLDTPTGYILNGTFTFGETCTGANCSTYTGSWTGTVDFTGAATFAITFNMTYGYDGTTTTCGGSISFGSQTYTVTSGCSLA